MNLVVFFCLEDMLGGEFLFLPMGATSTYDVTRLLFYGVSCGEVCGDGVV